MAVALVETARNLAGLLDVRQLVLAHRHDVALAEQDVARLVHRIREQKPRERMARRVHLGLHRGVAQKLGLGDQRQEGQHELVQRRNGRMREDDGLLGIDAAGQVVHHHVVHVVLDVLGGVAIGDHLVVGDDDARGYAHVLQRDAFADGAEVVAHVQTARGTVAREHSVLLGVDGKIGADLVGALAARFKTIDAHSVGSPLIEALRWMVATIQYNGFRRSVQQSPKLRQPVRTSALRST